jgi:protein gp37
MYRRFCWNETIRYDTDWDIELYKIKKPAKIFIGSTMELFGKWVKNEWMFDILHKISHLRQHTFIFLSKQPYNLSKWEFFDNCWVGISTTGNDSMSGLEDNLKNVRAKVKFVSIEPLLDYTPMDFRWVDWVIVGRQTPISVKTKPNPRWVENIVIRADKEGVPVFIKNNMASLLDLPISNLRQEFPK